MKTIINSILAGFCISIGGYAFLSSSNRVVGAFLFAIGLYLICTMGYALYTGRICYLGEDGVGIRYMLIVLAGNLVGTVAMGRLTRLINPDLIEVANRICDHKLAESWAVIPLAILCNVLIFYAVYGYTTAYIDDVGRYLYIFICVMVFILCGFEHCVANMYYFSVADFNIKCLLYLLLNVVGNSIGGIAMYRINEVRRE